MSINSLPSDNPIKDLEGDVLNRNDSAKIFAGHVLQLDVSEGAVVGVIGPWGSGKTSFINLAKLEFEANNIHVLDFNPWMFSGAEQLVERFFAEISVEMKKGGMEDIGKNFMQLGNALSGTVNIASKVLGMPQVGEIINQVWKAAKENLEQTENESVNHLREKTTQDFLSREDPLIVVIDDIDRLSSPEIRDIFKLVRLTASFPNLIYIMAFDRFRVEQAFNENGGSDGNNLGRAYLEKIVQFSFELPEVPDHLLEGKLNSEITRACFRSRIASRLNEDLWIDIYPEIIRPLIRNMRDIYRYVASTQLALTDLKDKVEPVDVVALEAIRMFLPDTFKHIPKKIKILTVASFPQSNVDYLNQTQMQMKCNMTDDGLKEKHEESIGEIIKASNGREDVARAMIWRLFPAGKQYMNKKNIGDTELDPNQYAEDWIKDHRVAHENILRLYLERVTNPDFLTNNIAEQALEKMANQSELENILSGWDLVQWIEIVNRWGHSGNNFQPDQVKPGLIALLNSPPDMSEWDADTIPIVRRTMRRIVRRLFESHKNTSLESMILSVWPKIHPLSSKWILILESKHSSNQIDNKQISEQAVNQLEKELRKEIQKISADKLSAEFFLGDILLFYKEESDVVHLLNTHDSLKLDFAVLWNFRGISSEGVSGSRVVRRTTTISCKFLCDLYGGKERLRSRVENLNAHLLDLDPWLKNQHIVLEQAQEFLKLVNDNLTEPDGPDRASSEHQH